MDARNTTPEVLNSLITCPISEMIYQHPITVSSGLTFELRELINHLNRYGVYCPKSFTMLIAATYNRSLKEYIDSSNFDAYLRYESYDAQQLLRELDRHLSARAEMPPASSPHSFLPSFSIFTPIKNFFTNSMQSCMSYDTNTDELNEDEEHLLKHF